MKIIFVLDHFYPHIGGAETLFFNLIKKLSKNKNYKIKILTSNSGGITGIKRINNIEINYCKWINLFGHPLPNIFDLYRNIKKSDLVHTATYTSAFFSFFVSKILRKKIIVTVYEVLSFDWFKIDNFFRALIYFLFERFTIKLPFDFYIAISGYTRKKLINNNIDNKKIKIIYPFLFKEDLKIKENNFLSKLESKKIFLFFGRAGKTKGVFVLLNAIKYLKSKLIFFKDFIFIFVLSKDPIGEKLKIRKFINKNKLNKDIILINSFENKEELNFIIKKSYTVIIPSITEGFGFSAYESCLLNVPVIVSDAGSLPEIVSGRFLIFKNLDYVDLANKIIMALNYKFKKKKKFFIDSRKEAKKLINLYKKII
ncbi:MAG: glycosyltransferase family 4 protein [Candidatus Goldbacteria bacterium]|nr:glycosyltransferase family 4 protein [Candidatus Goldiibacteriota bacterium]